MNRSDFLSTIAAVFCGVLLPLPQRETIRSANFNEVLALGSPDSRWSDLHHYKGPRVVMVDHTNKVITVEAVPELADPWSQQSREADAFYSEVFPA